MLRCFHRRALLVTEVTYEPSSRLQRSRKSVLLITGVDLVLVKMTKATSTASRSSAAAAGEGSGVDGSSGADAGAEDAWASVLAQHELNKVR
jgi:hypothetical protein